MVLIRLLEWRHGREPLFHKFTRDNLPAYAILSHTWGNEEVTFEDMRDCANLHKSTQKAGWKKLVFCAEKAAEAGLRYIWVDTCCIDKKDAVELGAAINSMYKLYQDADRCYVYLSDVSISSTIAVGSPEATAAFEASRWFTRGWTLQELIAPRRVDFFSSDGSRLGDRLSLKSEILKVTGIPASALNGSPLTNFTIKERRSWAETRTTTIEEDRAYCLIGILNVALIVNYGEGVGNAFRRLEAKIHKFYKGIASLDAHLSSHANLGLDSDKFAIGLNLISMPQAAQPFVGRELELTEMHNWLSDQSSRSCVVLHGLGGIGKTQLAVAYALRHVEKFTAVFWLRANNKHSLQLSFRNVAQQISKHQPSTNFQHLDLSDLEGVVCAVKDWLDLPKNMHWLIIYDNHDKVRPFDNKSSSSVDLCEFLPKANHGSIIITTRSAQVAHGNRIPVNKFHSVHDSLQILSKISGRADTNIDPDAIALAEELDGLPLALSTAGAYLEHVTTPFSEYLKLYKNSWSDLQANSPQLSSYENRSLYTTWNLTFAHVQQQNAASAKLLKLLAYFDRQDIWFELLSHAKLTEENWVKALVENRPSFDKAISLLCQFGLVELDRSYQQQQQQQQQGLLGSKGYSVHGCVHLWSISVLNRQFDDALAMLALTCVAAETPEKNELNAWLAQRRVLHHATRQIQMIQKHHLDTKGMGWALNRLGKLYIDQGMLVQAEISLTRALQSYDASKIRSFSMLETFTNLGILYHTWDKSAEAQTFFDQALQGCNEILGARNPFTLNVMNRLGMFYMDEGKLIEAEQILSQALQGREEVLGPKHKNTLMTINNLGGVYAERGKLDHAKAMFIRVQDGFKETLGPQDPLTLGIINNIAILSASQGKLTEAEAMFCQALKGRQEALGPKHTATLATTDQLGALYVLQDKLAEAEEMLHLVLKHREESLGPAHKTTLVTVKNLGALYTKQCKFAEAEIMFKRALDGYEKSIGRDCLHSCLPVLETWSAYGDMLLQTDRRGSAELMYHQALSGYESVQGPSSERCKELEDQLQHLRTATAVKGINRHTSGKAEAAKPFWQTLLTSCLSQSSRSNRR